MIARAAEGSVRDALSLLDQAIAHGGGTVTAEEVRAMLGLADRARVIDLFEPIMKGDIAAALGEFRAQYEVGADPAVVLADLAEFTHLVTRLKVAAGSGRRPQPDRGRAQARARHGGEDSRSGRCRAPGRCCSRASSRCRASGKPAAGRRNGAGAARLCRRSADAGRGAQGIARGRRRRWRRSVRRRQAVRWRSAARACGRRRRRDGARNPATGARTGSSRQGGSAYWRRLEDVARLPRPSATSS